MFSHPLAELQIEAVEKVLSELDAVSIPKLMVWNKVLVCMSFSLNTVVFAVSTQLPLSKAILLLTDLFFVQPIFLLDSSVESCNPFCLYNSLIMLNVDGLLSVQCRLLFSDAYITRGVVCCFKFFSSYSIYSFSPFLTDLSAR